MKGQLTQEFFLSLSVYLAVSISMMTLGIYQLSVFSHTQDSLEARRVAGELGNAINGVYLAGDNTTSNLSFDPGGSDIGVSGRYLTVSRGNSVQDFVLLTDRLNTTSVNSSDITIRNNRGVIEIEEK